MYDYAARIAETLMGPPRRAIQARATAKALRAQPGAISTYWYRRKMNFGDLVTPYLLEKFGWSVVHAHEGDAQLLSTGSILQRTPSDARAVILGSGLIRPMQLSFPKAKILAVRGPLTRHAVGAGSGVSLGDPGLLMSDFEPLQDPKYPLGLVVHYADLGAPVLEQFLSRHGNAVKLINVRRQPDAVFADIASCAAIASSSLHGLIFADAAGRPRVHIQITDKVVGGRFKFEDHDRSLQHVSSPHTLSADSSLTGIAKLCTAPPAEEIEARCAGLRPLFRGLSQHLADQAEQSMAERLRG